MIEPRAVNIIVLNDNNERFLTATIDGTFDQIHPFCEIIVVDDYSQHGGACHISDNI